MRRPRARQRHAVTQWPAPRSPHHTLPLRRTLLLLRVVQLILRKRCRRHGDSTWRCAATVSLRAYCTPEGRPGPHSGSRHAPTPLHAQTQAQFCPTGLPVGRLPAATPHDRSCRLRTRPRGPSRCWFQANRSHTGGADGGVRPPHTTVQHWGDSLCSAQWPPCRPQLPALGGERCLTLCSAQRIPRRFRRRHVSCQHPPTPRG